jgi:NTE family protein
MQQDGPAVPIQLAIQGGGAKIVYLLAALHAVKRLEIRGVVKVTRIAGTSAGAIAGALYAAGVSMLDAKEYFRAKRETFAAAFPAQQSHASVIWKLLRNKPFWSQDPLRKALEELLPENVRQLKDLDIPLTVVATDLSELRAVTFKPDDKEDAEADLIQALLDSAGVPFLFRSASSSKNQRLLVDGGICNNLPSEYLNATEENGEVLGITFIDAKSSGSPTTALGLSKALLEAAMNASVLRSRISLARAHIIRTDLPSFDFDEGIERAAGKDWDVTMELAETFFASYANDVRTQRAASTKAEPVPRGDQQQVTLTSATPDISTLLAEVYETQQESIRFRYHSVRMFLRARSLRDLEERDEFVHEIVFTPSEKPLMCYKVRLSIIPDVSDNDQKLTVHETSCTVYDRDGKPIEFVPVPVSKAGSVAREYILFFTPVLEPDDSRAPFTLRVSDSLSDALGKLRKLRRDELITRAKRADAPVEKIEIILEVPEEYARGLSLIPYSQDNPGRRMTEGELVADYLPSPTFKTLGWHGSGIPPMEQFGCTLELSEGNPSTKRST